MNDDGDTKDDVKVPDGEVGEKLTKLFRTEEKDTSRLTREHGWDNVDDCRCHCPHFNGRRGGH